MTQRGNRFLIETHSDYMVDRARIAVREGRISGDDVSILYFEPDGTAVRIHSLSVDRNGNLGDAPPGNRDFSPRRPTVCWASQSSGRVQV